MIGIDKDEKEQVELNLINHLEKLMKNYKTLVSSYQKELSKAMIICDEVFKKVN